MPSGGGPVYQPTTVSYEPRSGHAGGSGALGLLGPASSMDSPLRIFRKHPRLQWILLLFIILSLTVGIAMLISSIGDLLEVREAISNPPDEPTANCVTAPFGFILTGVILTTLGVFAVGVYFKIVEWWPCPCFNTKQKMLARQLQCDSGNGCGQGIMALNPSTDPLVSHTQYAPVSELPSMRVEDEERRNLMPDNKDWPRMKCVCCQYKHFNKSAY